MNVASGPRAVTGTKRKDYPGVQARGQAMVNAWTTNEAQYVSPPITLVAFAALVTAYVAAQQTATETRTRGSAGVRNTKCIALWNAIQLVLKYVQGLADTMAPEAAATFITSIGLEVAKAPAHQKAELTAAITGTQGTVLLDANRGLLLGAEDARKHAYFNWQWSGDGGKTWTSVPSTPYASTEIAGLTLLSTYSFRVSVTVGKAAPGPWSQAVSLLIH